MACDHRTPPYFFLKGPVLRLLHMVDDDGDELLETFSQKNNYLLPMSNFSIKKKLTCKQMFIPHQDVCALKPVCLYITSANVSHISLEFLPCGIQCKNRSIKLAIL